MKKNKLTIKVLFDTNAIFTGSANDLFRMEIVELIKKYSSLSDIDMKWCLPETVLSERKFQMNKKGNELLPAVQKLEKILGHNLNITSSIVESRIDATIQQQLESLAVNVIKLKVTEVPWEQIIQDAIKRRPPFEDNEKEKGFRDALIFQTLRQLIDDSPATKSICRIVMITNDNLLNQVCLSYASTVSNLHVFTKIDELVSLINVLESEITEEVINAIARDAEAMFFIGVDEGPRKNTLFYTEKITERIRKDYEKELTDPLEAGNTRENGTWYIGRPGFEKKIKQRVYWKSIIEVEFTTYRLVYPTSTQGTTSGLPATIGTGSIASIFKVPTIKGLLDDIDWTKPIKEKVAQGRTRFKVNWSVTLKTNQKMISPVIESVEFIDTVIN